MNELVPFAPTAPVSPLRQRLMAAERGRSSLRPPRRQNSAGKFLASCSPEDGEDSSCFSLNGYGAFGKSRGESHKRADLVDVLGVKDIYEKYVG